jgi:hypothetical protein
MIGNLKGTGVKKGLAKNDDENILTVSKQVNSAEKYPVIIKNFDLVVAIVLNKS